MRAADKLCIGLLLAAAVALGTTKLEDPDAWTHLAMGREIVRLGTLPASEPFTFPSGGMPFYHMEGLFAVVLYLSYAAAGVTGVILLKAALTALLMLILWKDSGLPRDEEGNRATALMIRMAVLLGCLVMIRPRLVERPDLALMVFLSFTIYALNAYLYQDRHYLYWLPPLQILWANVHPSVLVGMVPFVAILAGGGTLRLLRRWRGWDVGTPPSPRQLKTVAAVFAGVLGASLINPYGLEALTLAVRFATMTWHKQYIVELLPPSLTAQPGPFIVTALVGAVIIATARRVPLSTVLLVAPFAVLALSARRFSFLLAVVAAPVLARSFVAFADWLAGAGRRLVPTLSAGTACAAAAATVLAVLNVAPFADARKLPGFGVNDLFLPERALRYLDSIGVGGRVFNTFHWGGYLAWRDFPRRLPIIDGRGYVEPDLLWEIRFARQHAALLEQLYSRYAFDVAVLAYPPRDRAEPDAFASPRWALVYWDDVALVYLRRSARLATHIERDEYRHVDPAKGPEALMALVAGGAGPVEAEIRRSLSTTPSSIGHMLLGFVKLRAGAYDEAIEEFERVHGYSSVVDAAQGLAMAHWKKGDLATAAEHYARVVQAYPTAIMQYNLGLALTRLGKDTEAVRHLERARQSDPQFAPVYPALSAAYRRLGQAGRAEELERAHATALARGEAESHLGKARQLSREGHAAAAVAELEASLRLRPRYPQALSQLGDVYLQQGRLDDALARQQAALQLDPKLALAHYGLARVYERRGDHASARRHFERYVALEPASYLAWTVRKALAPPMAGPGAVAR
jgi:tetratricopeptide (TPR) repeat protein